MPHHGMILQLLEFTWMPLNVRSTTYIYSFFFEINEKKEFLYLNVFLENFCNLLIIT